MTNKFKNDYFKIIASEFKLEKLLLPKISLVINASIVKYNSRIFCAYRRDNMDRFNAKNYLMEITPELEVVSNINIVPENENQAFEDVRLFTHGGQLLALYTYLVKLDKNSWCYYNGVGIGMIDVESGKLVNQQSLRSIALNKHEKNWIPLMIADELFLIANFEPVLRIIQVIGEIGKFLFEELLFERTNTEGWGFGEIRGGTPFIRDELNDDDWQYSFVHSSIYLPNGNYQSRYYFYTVARINTKTFKFEYYKQPMGYSTDEESNSNNSPYNIKRKEPAIKVVFPMGIMAYGKGVVVSYGKDDCVSRLKYYPWDELRGLFLQ